MCEVDGKPLNLKRALNGPNAAEWRAANDAELRKLIVQTQTMHAIPRAAIPAGTKPSYYNPQTKEKYKGDVLERRVRGTYGGNTQLYAGETAAKTCELPVFKTQINKVVSLGRRFSSIDLTDFYLTAKLPTPEYLSMCCETQLLQLALLPTPNANGKIFLTSV